MSSGRDGIWLGGIGGDLFGEENTGQLGKSDPTNDFLRTKYLKEYITWHEENHRFHDEYAADKARLQMYQYQKWALTLSAVAFAAIVINPNFTQRRSWYARKFIPLGCGLVAWQYAYRCQNFHLTNMLLKMNDYFPLEVKRTLQTKDFRHIANFDYKKPNRQLFDEQTGKSLS